MVFIGALQLMLDRGPTLDWFSSPRDLDRGDCCALVGLWVFLVQTLTAEHPFFDRALALDRNFVTCNVFGFFIGIFLFSTMALLPPMMQGLMGYSVFGRRPGDDAARPRLVRWRCSSSGGWSVGWTRGSS